ncbi:hypothetical protein FIU97_12905 [Roseivivax sp. THAF40]|uniref:hypothetical protein n=1 Tax=unclassified Roseivivax TaxID=2639302 RepID=UPI001268425C|nr:MULTISPECIES: hypothetical protein [unclassified Roseivivax]QFS83666.1 hypothetical protein FIV09_12585 [Roseivivax sp. THAF197b]QFT47474.1 hypothetical protein FIU97_12905 [Roseivivax sp. THAF40]
MKKIIARAALALPLMIAGIASADEVATEDTCANIHTLAEAIMGHRQNGVAMPGLMQAVPDAPLAQALIKAAYTQPRYSVPENQQEAIADFANDMAAACYSG